MRITNIIYVENVSKLVVGQVLFHESDETFYRVAEVYNDFAKLKPFDSAMFKNITNGITVYLTNDYIRNYILLPRT